MALLENPIGTTAENYLTNGNRLLLDLFNTQIEMCDALTDPNAQLEVLATRVEAQGFARMSFRLAVLMLWARWVMWRVRWKSRNSVKGRLIFRRWWSHRAVPELTPDWLLGWNT